MLNSKTEPDLVRHDKHYMFAKMHLLSITLENLIIIKAKLCKAKVNFSSSQRILMKKCNCQLKYVPCICFHLFADKILVCDGQRSSKKRGNSVIVSTL